MSETMWHMQGNWAPMLDETHASNLQVRGEIPKGLNGTFIRTGPNPGNEPPPHWFQGDGMVHGIRLQDGQAEWYRNAFIKTNTLAAGKGEAKEGLDSLAFGTGNTSVHYHNSKILTLVESSWPWQIDQDLNTIGVENFGGKLSCAMTAHPKVCPETGELLAFSYFQFEPPFLRYICIGADGTVKSIEPIDIPNMVMMHDFAITRNHTIFLDLPVVFDMELLATGMPFGFKREAGARIGVMPRYGTNADIKWFEIEPCFVFHTVNAHEEGSKIILTASRFKSTMDVASDDFSEQAKLWRWVIDLATGKVTEMQLDETSGDFGRVNDGYIGLPARHGYLMEMGGDETVSEPVYGSRLLKYDLETGSKKIHTLGGKNVRGGEPVFVQTGKGEDEGHVMTIKHDEATGQSSFVIIDAQNFDAEPVATIDLPQRVPYGAHGNWIPL